METIRINFEDLIFYEGKNIIEQAKNALEYIGFNIDCSQYCIEEDYNALCVYLRPLNIQSSKNKISLAQFMRETIGE